MRRLEIETVKVYKNKQAILTDPDRKALEGLADSDIVFVVRDINAFGTYSLDVRAANFDCLSMVEAEVVIKLLNDHDVDSYSTEAPVKELVSTILNGGK